jgi:16S rRNA (cytosine967-C5)-methyltransferase
LCLTAGHMLLIVVPYIAVLSRFHSYLRSANNALNRYQGEEPFAAFLKKFFAEDKKYGSTDRKNISHLCYCYFRCGKAAQHLPVEQRILLGLFLVSHEPNELLHALDPSFNQLASLPIQEKTRSLPYAFSFTDVFPWPELISDGIDFDQFCLSFFTQPDLFLRIRPGNEVKVLHHLHEAGLAFQTVTRNCVSLSNATKVDDVVNIDKEAVIQDYSSQQTANLLPVSSHFKYTPPRVWDCCAASGGKSMMIWDNYPKVDLVVSDIRESIIRNLEKRFQRAGIDRYKAMIADLTTTVDSPKGSFDLVMADVPCTGSGTWSRTPEQLHFFDENKIATYASLQKKILSKITPSILPGGYLLYSTCSVFRQENEDAVTFLQQQCQLEPVKMDLLKGYAMRADSMFAALLQRKL